MTKYNPEYLDNEEKELIESFENLDINKIPSPTKEEQLIFKNAAKEYIQKKESKMNIRIDSFELQKIKEKAISEGLKYSSWVKMILHKYLTGQLIEKKKA